jgi:hypothetical protein
VSITDPVPVDDIAANNAATGVLNIAQSLASGPGQTLPAAGYAASAAGDLNGDGFVDLVVASALQGTLIYPNIVDASGNKRVLAEQPLSLGDSGSGGGIALMDLDGDNALDIIVAKRDGGSRILRNLRTSPGSFDFAPLPALLGLPTDVSNAVAAGDLNGDGRPEIVLANSSPNLVFVNQGGGLFAQSAALGNDDSRDVVIANLYGDASPELVFANADANATLYSFNAATSGFDAASLVTGPTTSVAAGDFDRDGRTDLVFGRSGPAAGALSTLLLLNTTVSGGPGQFFLAAELGASPTSDVLAVDTDVDADLDIVAISLPGGHKIFSNNGSGQFMVRAEQFATASALGATAGKLSTDDRVDVAVTGAPGIAVFYNDGRGNLGAGDTGAPIIQLVGQPTVNLTVEDPYTDAGATATDAVDGNLTARIRVTNPVNTAVIGTYTVTYNVVDSSGNAATPVTRTVNVSVRSGTGGGGGGVFDLGVALLLALLVMARARSKLDVTRAPARAGSVRRS